MARIRPDLALSGHRFLMCIVAVALAVPLSLPVRHLGAQAGTIDAGSFQLTSKDFPPNTSVLLHREESNAALAQESQVIHFGPAPATQGRQTGYFESALIPITVSKTTTPVVLYYLVSVFGTATQARQAFADQRAGYEAWTAAVPRLSTAPVGESRYSASYTATQIAQDTRTSVSELFFVRGRIFIEVWTTSAAGSGAASPDASAAQGEIAKRLDLLAISVQGVAPSNPPPTPASGETVVALTPTAVPLAVETSTPGPAPSTTFSIVKLRPEPPTTAAAFDLTRPGLQQVAVGHAVNLAIYFSVQSVPAGSHAIVDFTVQRGYGVQFFTSQTISVADYPDTYRVVATFTPKTLGTDVVVSHVTINNVRQDATGTLKVVKATSNATPLPVPRGSITPSPSPPRQGNVNPKAFAVPISAFPPRSKIVISQVEPNGGGRVDGIFALGGQSLASYGRSTGYYMSASTGSSHAVLTQYLVSIFGTASQAASAFSSQRGAFVAREQSDPTSYQPLSPEKQVGDMTAFHAILSRASGHVLYTQMLFFTEGRVLVEITQSYFVSDATPYGKAATPALYVIAARLATIARKQSRL